MLHAGPVQGFLNPCRHGLFFSLPSSSTSASGKDRLEFLYFKDNEYFAINEPAPPGKTPEAEDTMLVVSFLWDNNRDTKAVFVSPLTQNGLPPRLIFPDPNFQSRFCFFTFLFFLFSFQSFLRFLRVCVPALLPSLISSSIFLFEANDPLCRLAG